MHNLFDQDFVQPAAQVHPALSVDIALTTCRRRAGGGAPVGALIYGLEPRDPMTLVGAIALLATVAGLAAWLPARRAARIDPAAVLRES